jgi:glycosyltransferase involved in cell wall biosynthesis
VLAASWLYFFLVVYPAVIVGKLRCKRVVLNYRGGEARQFFRWFGWAAKPLFAISDVVAVPSEFLAELIRDRFGTQALIVPNIVDSSAFRYRPRVGLQPKLLVTRHLEELYDIESVIRAFQKVQRNHPDASLWIAGTGSLEDYLRGMVKDWNLGNVRFLGHVAHQALPAIYDQCDIYLNASRADNFPGALLEASASGLVVISTAVGGIPFIYQDGKSALLVAPGDWEGLARGAETVLQEPSLALELCTQAVAIIRKCEWCDVSKALYKAYGSSTKADGRKLAACASTENSFSTSIHRTSGRGL